MPLPQSTESIPVTVVSYEVDPEALVVHKKDGWDIDPSQSPARQVRDRLAETPRWEQANPVREVIKRRQEAELPTRKDKENKS